VPFGPSFFHLNLQALSIPFILAMLGLALNEAAYMAEIIRAGISSVPEGQSEASTALGMSWGMTMRRTVIPQAMRVIIPPTGNEVISMLKTTSLVTAVPYAFDCTASPPAKSPPGPSSPSRWRWWRWPGTC
jgi:ABC-type amino acid transport system, permease component